MRAIIERVDGGITIKVLSKKYDGLIGPGLIDFLTMELTKRAKLVGGIIRDVGDDATINAKLPWLAFPAFVDFRRNAGRWNGTVVVDDLRITTNTERNEAISWEQETAIAKPDVTRSAAERKLAAGRPDLLDTDDTDDIVVRWRGSGKAPTPSAFTPPADRVRPSPPSRRR